MAAFNSDAAAYVVGIVVGIVATVVVLVIVGVCLYRRLSLHLLEGDDEELMALRREIEEIEQERDARVPRPQTSNQNDNSRPAGATDNAAPPPPDDDKKESPRPKFMTAAVAATVKRRISDNGDRKQAWKF